MAFNAGAFAGALGQSALSTYERMGEASLRNIQRAQLVKDIQEKEALDTAWRESQARVGQQDEYGQAIKTGAAIGTEQAQALSTQGALRGNTAEDQAFERASAEAAVGAMRENAAYNKTGNTGYTAPAEGQRAPQAALPEMKPSEYTKTQGMEDYLKAAGQVSRKGTMEAIQLKQMVQQSEAEDSFRKEQTKLNDTLARIQGTAESGGLKGLYEAGKSEGLKLAFVEGKNGIGSRINVLGPKGDVLETVSDISSATEKLSQSAMQQFMQKSVSLLGSPDKVLSYMQKEKELGIKQSEVDIKKPYYAAAAGESSARARALSEGAESKKAGAVYLNQYAELPPEKQNGPEGQALLRKAEVATAMKSGDVSRIAAGTPLGRVQTLYENAVKKASELGEAPPNQATFYASQGFAPGAVMEGEQVKAQQLVASGKIKEAEALVKKFNQTFKNTPIQLPEKRVVPAVPR